MTEAIPCTKGLALLTIGSVTKISSITLDLYVLVNICFK